METILYKMVTDVNFLGAFLQTIIIIALGYILKRKNIISDEGKGVIATLLLKVAVPCMAFNAFMTDFERQSFISNILILLISFMLYIVFIGISKIMFRKYDKEKAAVFGILLTIGQVTLFSMPILKSIYPDSAESMLTCNMITIGFRVMVYIYSYFVISRIQIDRKSLTKSIKNIVCNPIIIAMLTGMFIWVVQNHTMKISIADGSYSFLRIDKMLPALYKVILSLEKLVSPLAMLTIGVSLGQQSIKDALSQKLSWVIAFGRTIVMPIIVLFIICLSQYFGITHFDEITSISFVLCFGAPVSATIGIYCVKYENEGQLASQVCLISTLLCIISIPLLYLLTEYALTLPIF